MPVCDGCGTRADEAHIRSRNERIELALRYRPTQIKVLILDAAPPARIEDAFYQATRDRSVRSVASRMYFDELVKASGVVSGPRCWKIRRSWNFEKKDFFWRTPWNAQATATRKWWLRSGDLRRP